MQHYLRDPTFSRFDTIPECDRQTDTRGRQIPRYSIASRGENSELLKRPNRKKTGHAGCNYELVTCRYEVAGKA